MSRVEHCAGILPLRKNEGQWQVLLALHVKGEYWAFPKGHYDPDEPPKEAAKRELFEETNLIVDSFFDVPPFEENYTFKRENEEIHKYVQYFPAQVKGDLLVKEPHEVKELKWFSFQEAVNQITFDESKLLFQKFIDSLI